MNTFPNPVSDSDDFSAEELLDRLAADDIAIEVADMPDTEPRLRLRPPDGFIIPPEVQQAVARHEAEILILLEERRDAARAPVPIRPDVEAVSGGEPQSSLPEIDAGNYHLPTIARQAWEALQAANNPPTHFRRGNGLVRLEGDDAGRPLVISLIPDRLRFMLARSAWWYRITRYGIMPALPPLHVVKDMLADPSPLLPRLMRIVETAVFTATGNLVSQPGYHAGSGIYYAPAPGLVVPAVPGAPTIAEIAQARELLFEMLCDFPFVGDAERANAIAVLFEQPARDLIDGPMPLHCIEAPTEGTGKGLLAEILLLPFTDDRVGVVAEAQTDDEWRKRITTVLRNMSLAMFIDNVRHPVDSGVLAAALTATYWDDRLLGTNDLLHLPIRNSWLMTGNNPVLSREIARRTVRTRLDAKVERPFERTGFRHPNLKAWVTEQRGTLVAAVLTLVRAWIVAGKPEGTVSLGSYERWAAVIGGILDVAGIPGFLENRDALYEVADGDGEAWRRLIDWWWERHHDTPVTAGQLFELADKLEGFDFGKGDERARRISLGKQLAQKRDRVIGVHCVTFAGEKQHNHQWRLVALPPPPLPSVDPNP